MVKNQVHSSQSGTFDISAAMLHIIAMTSGSGLADLRRKARVSHLCIYGSGRIFSHAQL